MLSVPRSDPNQAYRCCQPKGLGMRPVLATTRPRWGSGGVNLCKAGPRTERRLSFLRSYVGLHSTPHDSVARGSRAPDSLLDYSFRAPLHSGVSSSWRSFALCGPYAFSGGGHQWAWSPNHPWPREVARRAPANPPRTSRLYKGRLRGLPWPLQTSATSATAMAPPTPRLRNSLAVAPPLTVLR